MTTETKLCQSCIERGYSNPQPAYREWQPGIFYCDDCFNAILQNMMNIPQASSLPKDYQFQPGPILEQIYKIFDIPPELQFDRVDTVCSNRNKIFLHHAPANVNKTVEELAAEAEQLKITIFQCQYKLESIDSRIALIKEQARKDKGLKDYDDSKEAYSKVKKPVAKANLETRVKKQLTNTLGAGGIDLQAMVKQAQEMEKKRRERQFNILAGNCPECGGKYPCTEHPNEVLPNR